MQHTEKYRFDLIEKDDVFSPDALNENMEKVEGALETKADADVIDARVRELEIHKFAVGHLTAGGTEHLGFAIKALLVAGPYISLLRPGETNGYVRVEEDSFYHGSNFSTCTYIAFF